MMSLLVPSVPNLYGVCHSHMADAVTDPGASGWQGLPAKSCFKEGKAATS